MGQAKQIDMLHGPIWRKLLTFAGPVAATAILAQLFNASDLAIVGNFAPEYLRTGAVAAVGANAPVIALVVNLFVGIALGANVVIANAIGRNHPDDVRKAVRTSVALSLIVGVAVSILGEVIADPFLRLLAVTEDVLPLAIIYLRIYFLGVPVILLYNFEAAIFRSVGETKMPLIALASAGVLNVILNIIFVMECGMSVEGVALATVIANVFSALILHRKLRTSTEVIHLGHGKLGIDRPSLRRIIRIGVPAGIQSAVFAIANVVVQSGINSLGVLVMAGSSAAYTIEVTTYYLANSFSQACTTFVGQNYGAGKLARCRKTLWQSLIEGAVVVGVTIILVLTFGRPLLSIFNADPAVIDIGYIRLMAIVPAHLMVLLYETMSGYLRGFGISLVPAVLTMAGICGIRIIWMQTAFVVDPTFQTIMNVYPISLAATAAMLCIAVLIYRPTRRFAHIDEVEKEGAPF